MTWEILKTRSARSSPLPIVSFRESGTISMTTAARKMLGETAHVRLGIDRVGGRVGFFPCSATDEGSRAIYGKGGSFTISARTIIRDEKILGRFRLIPYTPSDREPKPCPRAIIRMGEVE